MDEVLLPTEVRRDWRPMTGLAALWWVRIFFFGGEFFFLESVQTINEDK